MYSNFSATSFKIVLDQRQLKSRIQFKKLEKLKDRNYGII